MNGNDQKPPVFATKAKVYDCVVMAKPATPEQIRAEQEAKLKEHVDGPGNSSPL